LLPRQGAPIADEAFEAFMLEMTAQASVALEEGWSARPPFTE
jgi:hypothetical protein